MSIKLCFYGAAQNVTGSCYILNVNGRHVLIDCGLYQEHDLKGRNWEAFPVPAKDIQAVIITHAHLDHCGRLPKLVSAGFRGPIFATEATADITKIVIQDCAKINMEDAEFKKKRHEREGRRGPYDDKPLYTLEEANRVMPLLTPCQYATPIHVADGIQLVFHEVGHILGAAYLELTVKDGNTTRRIVFSGDVGRCDMPILRDPEKLVNADYVICESTYGDRLHETAKSIPDELADVINTTVQRGGNLIIPSFAIERTQELIYFLAQLLRDNRIPHLRVFIDSPMAVKVSDVFKRHPELYDEDTKRLARQYRLPGLTMVRTQNESKSINYIKGSVIVIAGAGMCTGGRIKHHLAHNISNASNTVLFVGYQATGTLGRIILDGRESVRILGEYKPVRAHIERIEGFSAHADQRELCNWLKTCTAKPRRIFVTHGEPDAAYGLSRAIRATLHWETHVPAYKEEITLE